jgi:hypothetical protein
LNVDVVSTRGVRNSFPDSGCFNVNVICRVKRSVTRTY